MGAIFLSSWKAPVVTLALELLILCCPVQCRRLPPEHPAPEPAPSPLAPAMFVFGDSLVDVGNNNFIGSLARANFYPNGIDFPGRNATGRFCNGKTVFDYISEYAGLPYPPPFMDPKTNGQRILQGVNYASGAGGILDSSGSLYVQRIGLNQQLRNFETTIVQLYFMKGFNGSAVRGLLNGALYAVVIGSNDYINNYLQATDSPTKGLFSPRAYQDHLLAVLSTQLKLLYTLGARKVVVTNVGPLGCIPEQMSAAAADVSGRCVPETNELVVKFNAALRRLLRTLNEELPSARFVYSNIYRTVVALVSTPRRHGFKVGNEGCCGMGRFNGQFPCLPTSHICDARAEYVFWDGYHPTQAANKIMAERMWGGGLKDASPVNVQQLVTS